MVARVTGWPEKYILHMPLRRLYQYVHVAMLMEGTNTSWHGASASPARELEHLTALIKHAR